MENKKRGRKKSKDPMNRLVVGKLTESQYDLIKEHSKARNISISNMIRQGLQMYMETNF